MNKYAALYELGKARIQQLRQLPVRKEQSLQERLEEHGITRREFIKWSAVLTSALALPMPFSELMAEAAEVADRVPLIWLNLAECTGCTESLLRAYTPDISTLIFDHVSVEYYDAIMAASGWQAEENLENAMRDYHGQYLLVFEGAVPLANGGTFLTIGGKAHTGLEIVKTAAAGAGAIISVGTCASFGGVQAARPNPTGAQGIHTMIDRPVVNISGCPPSSTNITGMLMYFIMFGKLPALDLLNRPKWAYGARVHDNCERRGHFDAGEFVEMFGDNAAENGYCLYKRGCKGPYTYNNCPQIRFNSHTSWPVMAGHGCIGCSEPDFWDTMADFEQPLSNQPVRGVDVTADKIGTVVLGVAAVGIAAHAVASLFAGTYKGRDNQK